MQNTTSQERPLTESLFDVGRLEPKSTARVEQNFSLVAAEGRVAVVLVPVDLQHQMKADSQNSYEMSKFC